MFTPPDTKTLPPEGATHRVTRTAWTRPTDNCLHSVQACAVTPFDGTEPDALIPDGPSTFGVDTVAAQREARQELFVHGWKDLGRGYARAATPAELRSLQACPDCQAPQGAACQAACTVASRRRAHPTWAWAWA